MDKEKVRGMQFTFEQGREMGDGDWFTWRSTPNDDLIC